MAEVGTMIGFDLTTGAGVGAQNPTKAVLADN